MMIMIMESNNNDNKSNTYNDINNNDIDNNKDNNDNYNDIIVIIMIIMIIIVICSGGYCLLLSVRATRSSVHDVSWLRDWIRTKLVPQILHCVHSTTPMFWRSVVRRWRCAFCLRQRYMREQSAQWRIWRRPWRKMIVSQIVPRASDANLTMTEGLSTEWRARPETNSFSVSLAVGSKASGPKFRWYQNLSSGHAYVHPNIP